MTALCFAALCNALCTTNQKLQNCPATPPCCRYCTMHACTVCTNSQQPTTNRRAATPKRSSIFPRLGVSEVRWRPRVSRILHHIHIPSPPCPCHHQHAQPPASSIPSDPVSLSGSSESSLPRGIAIGLKKSDLSFDRKTLNRGSESHTGGFTIRLRR